MIKSRSYLKDYKQTADGQYVYTGEIYSPQKGKDVLQWLLPCMIAAAVIGSGCINFEGMHGVFYVILPYILEVSAAFVYVFHAVKLLTGGKKIKAHVLNSSAKRYMPISAAALSIFATLGIIGTVVLIITGGCKLSALSGGYIACKAASAALGVIAFLHIKRKRFV